MNKSALKNFAIVARKELRDKVKMKAMQLGITEENIKKETVQSSDAVFIDSRQLTIEEQSQRNGLIEEIKKKGYNQVIEEVAYTWFNRFTALRFMEVNKYLPTKVRVLSSENEGSYEPDIIREALNIDLDVDRELVYRLRTSKDNDAIDKLYKYLIIKQCDALNDILPLIFEKILDYTELLFPDGLLSEGSFLRIMTDSNNIPEDNWENVEVIGWLYQYYISERKDEVFEGLRKNKKIGRDDIAPATQLFTPHWIVKYMVENSLGKLWQEGHPNEELKKNWKYYIEEAEQEEEVKKELDKLKEEAKKLKVEDIKIIDPAMGSGHILVYAFEVLYDIYLSEGYMEREIPKLILEKNLYGIDIDERAFQLAYFALMMKGRSRSRRFFNEPVNVNIIAIKESNGFPKDAIKYFLNSKSLEMEKQVVENDLEYLIDVFHDAKEYGSILKFNRISFDLIEKRLEELRNEAPEDMFELRYRDRILEIIPDLVKQGRIMSDKYDVYITNPPYMGSKGMNPKLSEFVRKEYPDTKMDLFAVFMELDENLVKPKGYMAMINQHSWMFLSSFEKYRERLLSNRTIDTMLHLGPRAFEEIGGEVVQSTAFVNRKVRLSEYKGAYIRLVDYNNAELKEEKVLEVVKDVGVEYRYASKTDNFGKIPGSPVAYWVSENLIYNFLEKSISDLCEVKLGISPGNTEEFIKCWNEVSLLNIEFNQKGNLDTVKKWFPCNKGGSFRKWYGNREYVMLWEDNGFIIRNYKDDNGKLLSRPQNIGYQFKSHIGYSRITSSKTSFRIYDDGFMFTDSSAGIFNLSAQSYLLGFLNTEIAINILNIINPTLNYQAGDIAKLPIVRSQLQETFVDSLVKDNISISKTDWDSFETSWDFKKHPLLQLTINKGQLTIKEAFNNWKEFTESQFNQLKSNEEQLNRIFIEIYGLQDELTPEVEDKDITITKVVDEKSEEDKKNSYTIDRKQAIESFLSYAVGCIFGRYSLYEEGLIYAGGDFKDKFRIENGELRINTARGWEKSSIDVTMDNIIQITDPQYYPEDIVTRFIDFVKVSFGEENLNDNLKFISESLGARSNELPRETIRRYFLNDFYKNHVQTYKKRPIYWLFTSGREKAFNALIYMHRYDSTTLARIRTDYLHVLQSRFDAEKQTLAEKIKDSDTTPKEKRGYEKELKDLEKKIAELKAYDEVLHHMADKMIEIDLDDGVKVNYEIFEGLVQKI